MRVNKDPLLTEKETAEEIDVRPQTLARWRMLKEGPPFTRIGRNIRYRRTLLDAWLDKQTVQTVD